MNILEVFANSVKLILTLDHLLFEIIILSLKVSFLALIISSFFALIIGYLLALKKATKHWLENTYLKIRKELQFKELLLARA